MAEQEATSGALFGSPVARERTLVLTWVALVAAAEIVFTIVPGGTVQRVGSDVMWVVALVAMLAMATIVFADRGDIERDRGLAGQWMFFAFLLSVSTVLFYSWIALAVGVLTFLGITVLRVRARRLADRDLLRGRDSG